MISVYLNNISNESVRSVIDWAHENCPSFIDSDEIDVSGISKVYNTIYTFLFMNEDDANWFKLRWNNDR